jgi:hypothetical protein
MVCADLRAIMSEGNEKVREQYWSLALVSYILYAMSG